MSPVEPDYFVEVGPKRVVGPVALRAVWRALRAGTISFQAPARPAGGTEWRPIAWWLGEGDAELATRALEFDDRAPTLVRPSARGPLRSGSGVLELDVDPDEDEEPEVLARTEAPPAVRAPSIRAPAAAHGKPSAPSPTSNATSLAPTACDALSEQTLVPRRGPSLGLKLGIVAAAFTATLAIGLSPLRDRIFAVVDGTRAPRGEPAAMSEPSPAPAVPAYRSVDDDLARALRRADRPAPPRPEPVSDPCDGLSARGRSLCAWAGSISIGKPTTRPSFTEVQSFLNELRVRHAGGTVLAPVASAEDEPTLRVTVDGAYGYCLVATTSRFPQATQWTAWVAESPAPVDGCIRLELADFAEPLMALHKNPAAPDAASNATKFRRALAVYAATRR